MYFTQGLHRAVQQRPDETATICSNRTKTYQELSHRVACFAAALQSVTHIDGQTEHTPPRIAILSTNSDYYLESYLAIAWMGGVAVPVNYRWSPSEIAFSLQDCDATVLLVEPDFLHLTPYLQASCPKLSTIILLGNAAPSDSVLVGDNLIEAFAPTQDTRTGNDALLGIFYTGGTTGKPKGVMLTHRNILSTGFAALATGAFTEGCVGLHTAPMFHLADMVMLTSLVLRGGTHVMLGAFDPAEVLSLINRHAVTETLIVPAMLAAIVNHPNVHSTDLSSLKHILYGASPAPEALITLTLQNMPCVKLIQGYGMTESAGLIAFLLPEAHTDTANPQRLRAAGRAVLDVELRIIDQNDLDLPAGKIGEIAVRGPNVMQGYLNLPEQTSTTLAKNWLRTGDLAYIDNEGYIFIVDRSKDMIISGGENVYSSEVENTVAKHPAVTAVAIIGIPDDTMGEVVHAAVMLRPDTTLSLGELQKFCRDFIAGYKVPRSLDVISEMPMSGAGKILKTELRKPFWSTSARSI